MSALSALRGFLFPQTKVIKEGSIKIDQSLDALQQAIDVNRNTLNEIIDPFHQLANRMRKHEERVTK